MTRRRADIGPLLAEIEGDEVEFSIGDETFVAPGTFPLFVSIMFMRTDRELDALRMWLGDEQAERFIAAWPGRGWPEFNRLLAAIYEEPEGEASASAPSSSRTRPRSSQTSDVGTASS